MYPDKRLFMMSNVDGSSNGVDIGAPDVAQHRYGITWTGDIGGHLETLQDELEFTVQYGANRWPAVHFLRCRHASDQYRQHDGG